MKKILFLIHDLGHGGAEKVLEMKLELDDSICTLMEYFEIFMERMLLCRKAAEKLGCNFALFINDQKMI